MPVHDPHPLPAADRRAARGGACLLAAVAGFYLLRGMPWVNVDDFFFANAGIELARAGRLVNPPIDGWLAQFGTDKFYVHLPFHTYSLAAWVRVFGVHTRSFLLFEWLFYAVGCFGLVRTLGRFLMPLGLRLFLATVYLTLLITTGFRPEAEAFGLLFLGLGLLDATAAFGQKLAALLLLGFSVLTYPLTLGLAVPFAGAILWVGRAPGTDARTWAHETLRVWAWPLGMAAGLVFLSFLAMIHFELARFWAVFSAHRRLREPAEGPLLGFLHLITGYEQWLLTAPTLAVLVAAALYVAGCWRRTEPETRALVAACLLAAAGCVVLYATRAPGWAALLALCAGGSVAAGGRFARYRWRIVLVLAGIWGWGQSTWIVDATLRRSPDPAVLRAAREHGLRTGKRLVVDSSTARDVFDYQLPPQTRCLDYLKPWRVAAPVRMADQGDACWVVSPFFLECYCADVPRVYRRYPRITVAGHEFTLLPQCPDEPLVLP